MTTIIGIDPGKLGAIAVYDPSGTPTRRVWKVPLLADGNHDWRAAYAILRGERAWFDSVRVVLEKVQYIAGDGGKGSFSFGGSFHGWQALVAAAGYPLVLVTPQKWKATVLYGGGHEKADAVAYARRTWPDIYLRATPRCKKDDDNMAEALCLAEYGRRLL